jgi:hypothetical protein
VIARAACTCATEVEAVCTVPKSMLRDAVDVDPAHVGRRGAAGIDASTGDQLPAQVAEVGHAGKLGEQPGAVGRQHARDEGLHRIVAAVGAQQPTDEHRGLSAEDAADGDQRRARGPVHAGEQDAVEAPVGNGQEQVDLGGRATGLAFRQEAVVPLEEGTEAAYHVDRLVEVGRAGRVGIEVDQFVIAEHVAVERDQGAHRAGADPVAIAAAALVAGRDHVVHAAPDQFVDLVRHDAVAQERRAEIVGVVDDHAAAAAREVFAHLHAGGLAADERRAEAQGRARRDVVHDLQHRAALVGRRRRSFEHDVDRRGAAGRVARTRQVAGGDVARGVGGRLLGGEARGVVAVGHRADLHAATVGAERGAHRAAAEGAVALAVDRADVAHAGLRVVGRDVGDRAQAGGRRHGGQRQSGIDQVADDRDPGRAQCGEVGDRGAGGASGDRHHLHATIRPDRALQRRVGGRAGRRQAGRDRCRRCGFAVGCRARGLGGRGDEQGEALVDPRGLGGRPGQHGQQGGGDQRRSQAAADGGVHASLLQTGVTGRGCPARWRLAARGAASPRRLLGETSANAVPGCEASTRSHSAAVAAAPHHWMRLYAS